MRSRFEVGRFIAPALVLLYLAVMPDKTVAQWTGGPTGPIHYNGGNVGIGTASPLNLFQVRVGPDQNLGIRSYQGSAAVGAFNDAGNLPAPMNFDASTFSFTTGSVGIGTTNPQYKLAVEGAIGARDIIVTNAPWSDYVFRPDYRLRPLSEVNAFIQQHRHLPDIPSEAEVKEKGISVAEIQAKLLAKIEELTLHLIQANERIQRLEQKHAKEDR